MNWDAIGALVQAFGAIAVLVTLFYLAAQIKQSNNLARFSASKELMIQFNDLNRFVAEDRSLRSALLKADELTADEEEQVYNFAVMFCNVWYSTQAAYDNEQIDKQLYLAGCKDVEVELRRWPNFGVAVKRWLASYPEMAEAPIFKIASSRLESL